MPRPLPPDFASYRTLFECDAIGVAVTDDSQRFLDCNRTLAAMFGYEDPLELVGWSTAELAYLHDLPDESTETEPLRRRQSGRAGVENQYRRKDGSPVWMRLRLAPIEGTSMFFCFCEDISERKETELELQRRSLLLGQAELVGGVGAWVWYPHERRNVWSAQAARIFGYSAEEAASEDPEQFFGVIHPDDYERIATATWESFDAAAPSEVEYRIVRHCDGVVRWVREQGIVELGPDGKPERMFGAVTDVTEQKRVELELRETATYLTRSQQLGRVGSWAWYPHENRCEWSAETRRISGLTEEEAATGDPDVWDRRVVHPDDVVEVNRRTREAFDTVSASEYEFRILRSGEVRWLRSQANVELDEHGQPYRVIGVLMDVTDQHESRAELARLAEEQAALRRIATLVARAAPPDEVCAAVTEEATQLLPVDRTTLNRYESDGTVTMVAGWDRTGDDVHVGTRWLLGGNNISTLVSRTGRSARMESYADSSGVYAADVQALHSGVGAPIIVEGRLWGVMIASYTSERTLPPDTEARLADFTDLVASAIANAESRADLATSRARIIATADETRRRIERDLHDGAQQRLVSLTLELRAAQAVAPEHSDLNDQLSRVAEGLSSVQDELREMARGIHPAILAEGGLGPALKTLARRSPIPVELDVRAAARLPEPIEVAAYYVVSEALTNISKHANASLAHVEIDGVDGMLRVCVRDDGAGGADAARGSGLVGLRDRVEALGGAISIQSPLGAGTSVDVELPLYDRSKHDPLQEDFKSGLG